MVSGSISCGASVSRSACAGMDFGLIPPPFYSRCGIGERLCRAVCLNWDGPMQDAGFTWAEEDAVLEWNGLRFRAVSGRAVFFGKDLCYWRAVLEPEREALA